MVQVLPVIEPEMLMVPSAAKAELAPNPQMASNANASVCFFM